MKRSTKLFLGYIVLLFALTFIAMVWGQNRMQNRIDTILENKDTLGALTIENDSIRGVNIRIPVDIVLHQGKGKATFRGPKVMMEDFELKLYDGVLGLHDHPIIFPKGMRFSLEVYAESFDEILVSSSGTLSSDGNITFGDTCEFFLREKSQMTLNNFSAHTLDIDVRSGGKYSLSGQVDQLKVFANDDAVCDFSMLQSRIAEVKTRENAKVIVNATERITLDAGDNSNINYMDNAAEVIRKASDDDSITPIDPNTELKKPVQ